MNRYLAALLLTACLVTAFSHAQQRDVPCTIKFSFAQRDQLGNVDVGFAPSDQRWFEKKVMKQYPGICYVDQKTNEGIWFYLHESTQDRDSATATTQTSPDGLGGETSRTTVSPRITIYPVYTLKIGQFHGGNLEVLRTFQRTKAPSNGGTVTSLAQTFSNPYHDVILDAVDWISSNGALNASSLTPAFSTHQHTLKILIINAKTNHPITDEKLNVALRVEQIGSVAMPTDKHGIIEVKTGEATTIRILSNMYADCRPRGELYTDYSVATIHREGITTGNLCSDAKPKAKPGELILFEIPKTFIPNYPHPPASPEPPVPVAPKEAH